MNIPELLAPAGSREALVAAVQNGADAVYLGGKMFSARQYAANFDRVEIREAVEYAHIRGVKVYVTVNTLLADREFPVAVEYLRFLYETGVDAVIVQDPGVARVCRELLPGLPLHASTQMTVHNSAGVEILEASGFSRIVLARELSLAEISAIKKKTKAELEIFVHGALCVCYSGQCLMSSMIGGRSGNRGRCAQPCRMEYTLVDGQGRALVDPARTGSHLLSPMDLNMINHIPRLSAAGVCALKIEGRMKRPEYVATVVRIYRAALDRYRENPEDYAVDEKDMKDLAQIFNRGFTTGYFFGRPGRDMMSYKRPNNRGVYLGRVVAANRSKKTVDILLEDDLNNGDGIEFWVSVGGRHGVVVSSMTVDGRQAEGAGPGQVVRISAEGKIRPGDRVFKTHDAGLIARAEQSYKSPREQKKIPLKFSVSAGIGEALKISVADRDGHEYAARGNLPGREAVNKPLTRDWLEKQLDRLGNTPFSIGSLEVEINGRVMVPASEINEVRRQAIAGLARLRAATDRPPAVYTEMEVVRVLEEGFDRSGERAGYARPKLSVTARTLDVLQAAVRNGAEIVYFRPPNLFGGPAQVRTELAQALAECASNKAALVVATPRIVREQETELVLPLLEFAESHGLALLVGNLGILREAAQKGISVYADYPLNIYNSQTLQWFREHCNLVQAALSPELTLEQIAGISGKSGLPLEAVVEGHLPLMVTEYCPQGCLLGGLAAGSACRKPCRETGAKGLKDRLGLVFPIAGDEFCRTYIYNAKELCMIKDIVPLHKAGISVFRIETSIEGPEATAAVVRAWREELAAFAAAPAHYRPDPGAKERIEMMNPGGLTKGHYYRGVE